jgi:hypothetical protein
MSENDCDRKKQWVWQRFLAKVAFSFREEELSTVEVASKANGFASRSEAATFARSAATFATPDAARAVARLQLPSCGFYDLWTKISSRIEFTGVGCDGRPHCRAGNHV